MLEVVGKLGFRVRKAEIDIHITYYHQKQKKAALLLLWLLFWLGLVKVG